MVVVRALFVGDDYQTQVWISDSAAGAIKERAGTKENPIGALLMKLQHYARSGFRYFEGKGKPIRYEGDGVFRVGLRSDLFRLIGFYTGSRKSEFITVDTYRKRGQKRSATYTARVKKVARIKRDGLWRKANDD